MVGPNDDSGYKPESGSQELCQTTPRSRNFIAFYQIILIKLSTRAGKTKSSEATSHLLPKATSPGILISVV